MRSSPAKPPHTLAAGSDEPPARAIPWLRSAIGGLLMGLANLVPGVSGGTMILIMGLYDEFISAVADVTRLKFTLRGLLLLGVIVGVAGITIVGLSGTLARLVGEHPLIMYSLFIGMTLGGGPLLLKMIRPIDRGSIVAFVAGLAVMAAIGFAGSGMHRPTDEEKVERRAKVDRGEYDLQASYGRDIVAGVLGMSAMVLPGISGAYMLLLLGRYVQILVAVSLGAKYILTLGQSGDAAAFHIIIPVAIGVILSVVVVTNVLKWFLHHHEKPTIALLLGILIASAALLFERVECSAGKDYALAGGLLIAGFIVTILLGRIGNANTAP